jgi:hypothetical protein
MSYIASYSDNKVMTLPICPPKAGVKPVDAEEETERGLEYKGLREGYPALQSRKKFA